MTRLPDTEALALFAKVAQTGSFARTAEAYGLSKGTVSKAVSRLEARLGARLFHRTSRRLSLSETGVQVLARASRVLAEAEAAEDEAAASAVSPRGRVRLAAPMSFGVGRLAPLLPEFLALYPDVSVEVALDDRRVDLIAGGFDLALRIGVLEDSSLLARRLCPVRVFVVGSPRYLAARGRPARPSDLAGHACLSYTYLPSGDVWRLVGPEGEAPGVRVSGPLTANNGEAITEAACAGAGLAMLPDFIVHEALASGRLVDAMPGWGAPDLALNLVSPPGGRRPPKVQVLADFLVERFAPGRAPWIRG